eukprot:7292613-Prymnesium_polylepis.1
MLQGCAMPRTRTTGGPGGRHGRRVPPCMAEATVVKLTQELSGECFAASTACDGCEQPAADSDRLASR